MEHWEWPATIQLGKSTFWWENRPWSTLVYCIPVVVSRGRLGAKEWLNKTWGWQLLLIFLLRLKRKLKKKFNKNILTSFAGSNQTFLSYP